MMTDETDLGGGEYLDSAGNRWRREFDPVTGAWRTEPLEQEGENEAAPHDEAADSDP